MKKNRFKFWLCVFFVFCGSYAEAQTTKEYMTNHIEYTQGNYLPYDCMVRDMPKTTKPPKNYKPFYISHYGRHGSRFHYSSKDYRDLCDKFLKADSANALTPLGKSVKERFSKMNELYGDRAGDLTDKGAEQHRGIARRMMKSYPSVFKKNAYVDAKSSTTVRCVLSMDAFCQELKAENPKLRIHNESSKRLMCYLANDPTRDRDERLNDEAWSKAYGDLHYRLVHPSRMIGILFSDPAYVGENIDTIAFMRKFYEMKNSLASEDSDMNFDDVWTNEELYDNWVVQNAWWYGAYGPCPLTQNKSRFFANDLLKKIIADADDAIQNGNVQAHLRFGHDTALLPLTSLLACSRCDFQTSDLDSVSSRWNEFRIIPMAANVQFVFYKSKKNKDILLKVLLNEREVSLPLMSDVAPYYHWGDFKNYYLDLMRKE